MLKIIVLYFTCISVLPPCVYVYHVCAWYLQRSEEDIKSPGTEVMVSWEVPHGFWEPNLRPLQEQLVLRNTGPSLQPQHRF